MKISCRKEDLIAGVNTVQRAVSSKNTLPILQGMRLRTEDENLVFEATDLEIGIRCRIPVNVQEEGQVVLPAKLFSEITRKLPDTDIKIESTDKNINIFYYSSDFSINGYDPDEYPEISDISSGSTIELQSSLFKSMIKQTIFACSLEETRPVFTGLLLQIDKETICLVGTDTHRLAFSKEILTGNSQEFNGIIPSKTMQEIYRLLDDDETLTISFTNSRVIFKFSQVQIVTRLIEGQFPNYKQVIPPSCNTKLFINTKKLLDTVERASLLSKDNYLKTNTVRFNIENSQLSINHYSEMGKIFEQLDIEQNGEDVAISFNAKYLIDLLKVIDSENVIMEISGSFGPCIFRPENNDNYLCLVLPLRN
ncbi:DNA polymerase III subunit beta [Dehalobacter sp. DCM]|uniref:DNA polymerase III subunit beta n=1 Tax=Dehalobacter sp. DCM TaxID=2907827 RepID=UPI003081F55E|nr:DNA polymerase III subunit beta [Dehalobacter sp. DCM]